MSWGEVKKINDNMKKPLNEQIRNTICIPMRVITTSTTYTPEKTGIYKVICVGAGGSCDGYGGNSSSKSYIATGGGGGVAIKTLRLLSTQSYSVTVGTTASFGSLLSATSGGSGYAYTSEQTAGTGGTASGGDYNFTGINGIVADGYTRLDVGFSGGGTGVAITELSRRLTTSIYYVESSVELIYGESILGYGSGGCGFMCSDGGDGITYKTTLGQPGAVIIIPLEMEE